ncbi:MAG: phosphoribosylformylglycinamidine synthase subunit PurL [Thermoplasmatota archaeon]|nr:phosphoribosylformylglycinamidine synthase subunit PurL [Candidatus Thermoplasmatota archaeon]MBU1913938.1 phosphoribosylformylglycinamidine synthase subunit PurL [Candidatus Thermoplasmatota archaeon]
MSTDRLYIRREVPFELVDIDLEGASDDDLQELSRESGTGLSLEEMHRVRKHFKDKGRNPTDVEFQSLGQAWSEHCCYKSSKVFLKQYVFGINNRQVIDRGDAGVMEFDKDHAYALRIESHNHPSAVEPYGGAATGIGGIIRDVLCMGAQPIALVDPLFFGPLDYPFEKLPPGIKHPKYLFGGIVAGIRDYGNRVGLPTISGGVWFDESYVGNCLVNVGCVGIAEKKDIRRNAVKGPGDVLVLVGGRTGRDGIHGVTFASAVLTKESETESRGAVQLGDPIMKEPVIHALLDANEKGLVNGMKDLGGGGLSCVVGEIALAGGCGAEVDLSKVPLKEEGLAPWEIWVSESQERMMLSVSPKNVDEVLHVFRLWDVPATPVGKVMREKSVRLFFQGEKVFDLELEFLTAGPVYCRPCSVERSKKRKAEKVPKVKERYDKDLLKLLASPNICNKDWVIRQYDHEVRGNTVIKPLQGKLGHSSHGDAAVLKPVEDSFRGLAIATASNPFAVGTDPYRGGKICVDEMCRNLAAVGARPHSFTNCLNFGNPEKPDRLWLFREAVRGMGEVAKTLNIPTPSGNVSFYNEASSGAVLPTPTLLGCGIVRDVRKCVTSDLKREGNTIAIVGATQPEMGASEYYRQTKSNSRKVPDVDIGSLRAGIDVVIGGIERSAIVACHDISDGGLAVALAEMCIGGDIGAEVDLTRMEKLRSDVRLFSESSSRWVVELRSGKEKQLPKDRRTRIVRLGSVRGSSLRMTANKTLVDLDVGELAESFNSTLWRLVG